MGSKGPSWADQWGTDASRDKDHDDELVSKVGNGGSSKVGEAKAAASAGLGKAKAATSVAAQKVKIGTSALNKWVKSHCQKKSSTSK